MPVTYDDITGQLANENDNYKFSACSNSVLQEFAGETEVMIINHPELVRGIHVRHMDSSKVLERITSVTHALEIPWDLGIDSVLSNGDSLLVAACAFFKLSSFAAGRPDPPPLWVRYDSLVLMLQPPS